MVDVLEEQAEQRAERDDAAAEEGGGPPRSLQGADGLQPAEPLGGRRAFLVGRHDTDRLAPLRLPQPAQVGDHEDGGDGQQDERQPPSEQGGDAPGERPGDQSDAVEGQQVEAEDGGQSLGRVVVREQAVVDRGVDGLADAATEAEQDEDGERRRQAGADRGERPDERSHSGQADAVRLVGQVADGHGGEQHEDRSHRRDTQVCGVAQVEGAADLGTEDAVGGEVEPLGDRHSE